MIERRRRVLVIEDLPTWQRTFEETFEDAGYEVRTVATRADALVALDEDLFHLLVVDLRLNDDDPSNIDGMGFLRELTRRGLNEVFEVIVCTAYGSGHMMREAFKDHGVQHFLNKMDFDAEELLGTVNRIFEPRPRGSFSP